MENIYTQAIADAKAVRESAMANAKAAIQEAFEPKIKAMLKKHIVENEEVYQEGFDDYSDPVSAVKELDVPQNVKLMYLVDTYPKLKGMIASMVKKRDMDTYEIVEFAVGKLKPNEQKEVYDHFEPLEGTFEGKGEEDFDSELRSKLGLSSEMEEDYTEYDETMSPADEATPNSMDETTLDEILAELDEMDDKEATEELEEAFEMEEAKEEEEETEEESEEEDGEGEEEASEETKVVDITLGDLVDAIKAAMGSETPAATEEPEMEPKSDDISLDEILAELEEEMKEEGAGSGDYMDEAKEKKAKEDEDKKKAEEDKAKKELKEAKKAIEAMRAELNEVNLLNAKLLYVNKIFKAKSLTEAQKVKVLNAFDKATTVKEVKNTYNIVSEAITAAPKKQLKESFGFASKPAGVAPKTNTMESDPFIARMQKLAGL